MLPMLNSEWIERQKKPNKETAEANKDLPLVFLAFPVTGECLRTSQGHFESKYLPWYTEFTRVRVFVLIFELRSILNLFLYLQKSKNI